MEECWFCGKVTYMVIHSCTGVPRTAAAMARLNADPDVFREKLIRARAWPVRVRERWPVVEES